MKSLRRKSANREMNFPRKALIQALIAPHHLISYDATPKSDPMERIMAGRSSLDDKLAAIRALRGEILTSDQISALRKSIGDRSNFVVAAAALVAGENTLVELAKDLESAFDRFLVDPLKNDKGCRAKLAVVQALDTMEHQRADVFLKAARHVQLEPVWGGSEDTAAPLRAAALVALARVEGTHCLPVLVDALTDTERDVRSAAAVALGAVGSESAGLVLRLKVRIGDKDPDVLSECLLGLLTVNPTEYLPIVDTFLNPNNAAGCEAAAMALGKSRLAEALDPLKECLQRCRSAELRRHLLLAISIIRRPAPIDYLIELVATEEEPLAVDALSALRIHKDDPRIHERIANIVRERSSRALQAGFDREFG